MNEKDGWVIYEGVRTQLKNVRAYRHDKAFNRVEIFFHLGECAEFTFYEKDKAEEFMIALDQHFGVGENDSTIELKP